MSHPSSGSGHWGDPGIPRTGTDPDRTALRPVDGPGALLDDGADVTREAPRPFEPEETDRTSRRSELTTAPARPATGADPWQRPVPPTPPPVAAPAPTAVPAPVAAPAPTPVPAPEPRAAAYPEDATLPQRSGLPRDRAQVDTTTPKRHAKPAQPAKDIKDAKPTDQPRSTKTKVFGMVREIGVIVVGALIITTLLRSFVFQPFEVPSGSMENTLQINDKIIAQRVQGFDRGDIVVFADANGWLDEGAKPAPGPVRTVLEFVGLLPDSADEHLVKRVVGMPGDRVKCCDKLGRVSVNGYPLDESSYLYADTAGPNKPAEKPFEVVVPAGRIFVMGDHRANSGDSRCHLQDVSTGAGGKAGTAAFIPITEVVGSVVLIASPFSRVQRLETPQAYAGIPPPQQEPPPEPVVVQVSEGC